MTITRRELLGGGASTLGVALAGCSSFAGNCDDMNRSSIETEQESPPEDVREAIAPIDVPDLPDSERAVARTAIREGSYSECRPVSTEFESLLDRIREHRDEQQQRSEADLTTVYFADEGTHYALEAYVLDQAVSF